MCAISHSDATAEAMWRVFEDRLLVPSIHAREERYEGARNYGDSSRGPAKGVVKVVHH